MVDRSQPPGSIDRRTVLRGVGAGAATAGLTGFAGVVSAVEDCCFVCWIDLKPNSCPNAINPGSGGVTTVAAGWPNFAADTVELVPVAAEYDAAFDGCQDYADPAYHRDCDRLQDLLDGSDGRSATPVRSSVEDLDGDGDDDTVFKFRVADVAFEPEDTHVVLVGETESGCRVLGIDTVRVLDTGADDAPGRSGRRGSR